MKTLKIFSIAILCAISYAGTAQVSVNVNIGTPPMWGPVGYSEVRYYYLPDVESYYDVQSSMFIYFDGGQWYRRASLPRRYRNYDLYNGYKVVMSDYRGESPYENFREHKEKYGRGYHGESQRTIGERPGNGNSGYRKNRNDNNSNAGDKGKGRGRRGKHKD